MTHSAAPRLARPEGRDEQPASDERLLTAVRNGDSAAFAELYEHHRRAVLAVARMHSRTESDAQDLVSEAFTRVLGLLREGKGPREFLRAYLVTAVSRLAADRANELTRTRPEDPQPNGPLDRVELFDDTVVRQVDSAVVARAFASLPERWQEILWYLEVEGRRPRQVAGVVGAQPNAVSALGKRAREGLRAAYVQEHVSARALAECREFSSQLGAFTRGALTPPRTKAVQDHLDGCRRCTAEYLQLQDLGLGLRGWILPVLAGLPLWGAEGSHLATALAGTPLLGAGAAAGAGVAAESAAGASVSEGSTAVGSSGAGAASSAGGVASLVGSGAGLAVAATAVLVAAAAAVGIVAATNSGGGDAVSVAAEPTQGLDATAGDGVAPGGGRSPASGDRPAGAAEAQGAAGADAGDDDAAAAQQAEGAGTDQDAGAVQDVDDAAPQRPAAEPSLPIVINPPGAGLSELPGTTLLPDPQIPLNPQNPHPSEPVGEPSPAVSPDPAQTGDPLPSDEPQVTVGPITDPTPGEPQPSPSPSDCTISLEPGNIDLCLPW
ncbi:sigma-70 family RNA polymerase sigma factor [uncultured Kocuria sp.]|uniref:sigma-70 family RNA polymerase sigma factor n=1 Tax=uncultured Kocuria sp. TaxID=259305 RepID=UPI0025E983AF|nr:sigma-70 family RNA polymerase sigma factor [uncultured Kocuria sp.]